MKKTDDQSLMNPPMQELLEKLPQKYEAVLAVTRRAKQIIREQRLNPGAYTEEELHRKPLTVAINDIIDGRVDKESLMAPDLMFDDIEAEAETLFIDEDRFTHQGEQKEEPEPVAPVIAEEIDDDLPEVDDLFSLDSLDDDED